MDAVVEPVMGGKQETPGVKPEVPVVADSSSSSGVKRSQEDAGIADPEVVPPMPTPTLTLTLVAPKPEDVLPPVRAQLTYGNRTCRLSPLVARLFRAYNVCVPPRYRHLRGYPLIQPHICPTCNTCPFRRAKEG